MQRREPSLYSNMKLRSFQKRLIRAVESDDYDTIAMSVPRGNSKSWIMGYLASRILNPDDSLFRAGTESVLCAGSLEQARIVFKFAREMIGESKDYRLADSPTRIVVLHKPTRTALRVISSNAKTAMGLVNCPYVIADEPGSWEVNAGQAMYDAISTAMGKPGSPLMAIFVGTLAPATSGWWHDLVAGGTYGTTYVQSLTGDASKWDSWHEIRRCNPLTAVIPISCNAAVFSLIGLSGFRPSPQ